MRTTRTKRGWVYRARTKDCRNCLLRSRCISATANVRVILISEGYESLLRARRKRRRWDRQACLTYKRHRWRVEGIHGEAKTQHGLRRAVRRGLANVAIQVYLTAAVMNLKRLAALLLLFLRGCWFNNKPLGRRIRTMLAIIEKPLFSQARFEVSQITK